MQEYERKALLERIERDGATVGASIPDTVDLQGEPFELRSFVFEVKKADSIPPGRRAEVEEAKRLLRRERLQRRQRIEHEDLTREEAEDVAAAIVGIDRALNALESLGPTDLEAEERAQKAADTKRWMNFLKQALGRDDDSKRRGRR